MTIPETVATYKPGKSNSTPKPKAYQAVQGNYDPMSGESGNSSPSSTENYKRFLKNNQVNPVISDRDKGIYPYQATPASTPNLDALFQYQPMPKESPLSEKVSLENDKLSSNWFDRIFPGVITRLKFFTEPVRRLPSIIGREFARLGRLFKRR